MHSHACACVYTVSYAQTPQTHRHVHTQIHITHTHRHIHTNIWTQTQAQIQTHRHTHKVIYWWLVLQSRSHLKWQQQMVPSLVAKRLEHETKWHLVIEIHQTQPAKSCKNLQPCTVEFSSESSIALHHIANWSALIFLFRSAGKNVLWYLFVLVAKQASYCASCKIHF